MSSARLTRFAPSPTGWLHLGHLAHLRVLLDHARATACGLALRIEDHDAQRCRPEYEDDVFAVLRLLGVRWDMGPAGSQDKPSPFRQSDCQSRYDAAAWALRERGLLYACNCSRAELRQRLGPAEISGESISYDGRCRERGLALDAPDVGWRVRLPAECGVDFLDLRLGTIRQDPGMAGDPLLRDRHGLWTYTLCVVVDDLHGGVTDVVRGVDLLPATGTQLALRTLLAPESPSLTFLHHELVFAEDGRKLGKCHGDPSLREMIERGDNRVAAIWSVT